jgi:acetylornithine/succinyldiaminopimelate/putrescine aminotransferase
MLGIECERPVKDIHRGLHRKGSACLSAKEKVRLLLPLNIPFDKLKKAIEILKEELAV